LAGWAGLEDFEFMKGKIGTSCHGHTKTYRLDFKAIQKAKQILKVSRLLDDREKTCAEIVSGTSTEGLYSSNFERKIVYATWIRLAKEGKLLKTWRPTKAAGFDLSHF
jgi:hypothetical protein